MKKYGFDPFILLTGEGGDGGATVIGGGSGQGGSDPVPCSYSSWTNSSWAVDYNNDGLFSEQEYCYWWADQMADHPDRFTQALWIELNPGLNWDDYDWE